MPILHRKYLILHLKTMGCMKKLRNKRVRFILWLARRLEFREQGYQVLPLVSEKRGYRKYLCFMNLYAKNPVGLQLSYGELEE